jgi:RNA polymerase sigma-70 factor (ECF subfamily)
LTARLIGVVVSTRAGDAPEQEEAMDDADLADLIARAKAGDSQASDELRRLENDIRMIVRVRLPRKLRNRFDSMDFVQSVWESFLSDEERKNLHFKDQDHLRGYLAGMARNKVLEADRRSRSLKYNLAREEPLYLRRGDREVPRDVTAAEPTPSEDAAARDRLDQIMAGRSPLEAKLIELRLAGLNFDEIAAQVGLHERTVRRMMKEIRQGVEDRERP